MAAQDIDDILNTLSAHGLHAYTEGERILVEPSERITDAVRALIRAHRAELYAALCPPRPRGLSGLRRAHLIERSNGSRFWFVASRGTPSDAILAHVRATIDANAILAKPGPLP